MRQRWCALAIPLMLLFVPLGAARAQTAAAKDDAPVQFLSMFSADVDVNGSRTPCQRVRDLFTRASANALGEERPAVCDQVLDIVAGKAGPPLPKYTLPIRAARMAVDSSMRLVITEPATRSIHILDFARRKYQQIDGGAGDRMASPFGVALDAEDNIYATDLVRGRIAVYSPAGKFKRYLGVFGKNENMFDRPESIAIDRATGRIYLADSKRNFVLILDLNGKVLAEVGKRGGGSGNGEFMNPTDLAIYGKELFVLDKSNDRVQVLDLEGHYRRQFRLRGSGAIEATGMAFDAEGRLLVPVMNWVEVFDREGKMLFRFGQSGNGAGEFQTVKGICLDSRDRAYVIDAGNWRIQVFQVAERGKPDVEASR